MVADADLVGRIIAGKYAVRSVIGSGAMGTVYRARQVALDKIVALKVLNQELRDDPEFVMRFHTEARAASRLDHPHSTRVLDFGEEADGLLYIAMELLEGRTLAEVIEREHPLAPARVAAIVSHALSAVGAAHTTIRAEWLARRQQFDPDAVALRYAVDDANAFFMKQGAYVELEQPLTSRVDLLIRADGLLRIGDVPVDSPLDHESAVGRATLGLAVLVERHLRVKASSELREFTDPDVRGVKTETSFHLGAVGTF